MKISKSIQLTKIHPLLWVVLWSAFSSTPAQAYSEGRQSSVLESGLSGETQLLAQAVLAQSTTESFFDELETSPEQEEIDQGIIPDLPVGTEEDEEVEQREQSNEERVQETLQQLLDEAVSPEDKRELVSELMLRSLQSNSVRYPWLIDPTDNFGVGARDFRVYDTENYGTLDFQWDGENFRLDELTLGSFAKDDQFYWILPNNRIVFETQGWLGGVRYLGETRDVDERVNFVQGIDLWGLQAAYNVPQRLGDGEGEPTIEQLLDADIIACAAELESTVFSTEDLNIDLDCNFNAANGASPVNLGVLLGIADDITFNTGEVSTTPGGANLFEGLEDGRTPLILQSWPTADLRGLLSDGATLEEGSIISELGRGSPYPSLG